VSDDFIHCRLGRSAQFLSRVTAVVASSETTDLLDSASPTFADPTLAPFGYGTHYCLTVTLARLETTVALRHPRPQPVVAATAAQRNASPPADRRTTRWSLRYKVLVREVTSLNITNNSTAPTSAPRKEC
jgi:hypothetical protein